jgi:uracil-DNA glycosylase
MQSIEDSIKSVILNHHLPDWFKTYPWLTGYLGNPKSSIWFIGENPSLRGIININNRVTDKSENLQWNSHEGDKLLRRAITEAGLKQGDPLLDEGWNCYITNTVKEPDEVNKRNKKKRDPRYWKTQAERWMPVLQLQIDSGEPKVLIALGGESKKILRYMIGLGLRAPKIEQIHHYSYIMLRPEAGRRRGPGHPERIKEFKQSIIDIKEKYDT